MWISKRRLDEIKQAAYDQGVSVGYGFRSRHNDHMREYYNLHYTEVPEVYRKVFEDQG